MKTQVKKTKELVFFRRKLMTVKIHETGCRKPGFVDGKGNELKTLS